MKTNELISMLAHGAGTVEHDVLARRYWMALGWAAFVTVLLMALWLGVRRDIAAAAWWPMFWVKLAFPALMLLSAVMAVLRLSRPGAPLGWTPLIALAAVAVMVTFAVWSLLNSAPEGRERLIYGVSWTVCPFYIAALSVPAWVSAFCAMRGAAPTRPILAGAFCGLLAGAMGALAYALYCPEMAAPFIAIWYLAGMLAPAVAGALLGPLLLRW